MADGLPARADAAAGLQALAAQGLPGLQRQLAALLRTDRARLITALYRLDVDEAQARRWLAAAARDRDVTGAAAGLAELIVRRLDAKLRTTAAHRSRAHQDGGRTDSSDPLDKPRCNCAIVGIYGNRNAAVLAYQALYAMQHRGDESTGIVTSDGAQTYRHVGMGEVRSVFADQSILRGLRGSLALGHNRYSTTGPTLLHNAQPFLVEFKEGPTAISHNGNFTNTTALREKLVDGGAIFQTSSDTEVVLHLMARSSAPDLIGKIKEAFSRVHGAYAIAMITRDRVIGLRDPRGWRPLCLGRKGNTHYLVSETCALDLVGARYVREVERGEIVVLGPDGVQSHRLEEQAPQASCVVEYVYFARPDSRVFDQYVDTARRRLGETLADEHPADADIVIAVPDTANTAALGYSNQSGIPYELGIIRNHYVGRTFMAPRQDQREFRARVKFNTVDGLLKGRRVVVVDDSLVRGTTLRQLLMDIRKAGAAEVHVRICSPPVISPCFYGMDFPTRGELIASGMSVEEIRRYLRVDSLRFLSLEGMLSACSGAEVRGFCDACFTGNYPLPPAREAASAAAQ
ncbi:MAG: amidophosphoribosyltransferase [Spirochaetaceae bacterium]|nr:amidophosphoribosyltransferase [Spirochaetaceae bacterium]